MEAIAGRTDSWKPLKISVRNLIRDFLEMYHGRTRGSGSDGIHSQLPGRPLDRHPDRTGRQEGHHALQGRG